MAPTAKWKTVTKNKLAHMMVIGENLRGHTDLERGNWV